MPSDTEEARIRIIGVFVVLWHFLEQFNQESWTPNCITESFQEQLFKTIKGRNKLSFFCVIKDPA